MNSRFPSFIWLALYGHTYKNLPDDVLSFVICEDHGNGFDFGDVFLVFNIRRQRNVKCVTCLVDDPNMVYNTIQYKKLANTAVKIKNFNRYLIITRSPNVALHNYLHYSGVQVNAWHMHYTTSYRKRSTGHKISQRKVKNLIRQCGMATLLKETFRIRPT